MRLAALGWTQTGIGIHNYTKYGIKFTHGTLYDLGHNISRG